MEPKTPGGNYTSRLVLSPTYTGLVGTVRYRLLDNDATADDPVHGPSTADIIEDPTGSGTYLYRGTAPTVAGTYSRAWDRGPGTLLVFDEDLLVTSSLPIGSAPSGRDLCTLADVVRYVPAYTIGDNEAIDAKLQDLITAQSEQIMAETTREIVGQDEGPRDYNIDRPAAATGRVRIGDLSTLTGTTLTLINRDGTTADTITASQVVPLYGADLAPTAGWEPITCLELRTDLGAPTLTAGQTLRLSGPFGFPSIPPFVREACAARVIGRYLADVATTGDEFTQALDTVNFGGLFGNAEDALRTITPVVAA